MPRTKGDRPDVIPDGCVNFAFLGQLADTPRDTVFATEYWVRLMDGKSPLDMESPGP